MKIFPASIQIFYSIIHPVHIFFQDFLSSAFSWNREKIGGQRQGTNSETPQIIFPSKQRGSHLKSLVIDI